MTDTWLTEDDARAILVRKIGEMGTVRAVAKWSGCSESLVSRAASGYQPIGRKLGAALGLVAAPVPTFQYLRSADDDTNICR